MQTTQSKEIHIALGRFAALAFCRADMLFELDHNQKILFSAGALSSLVGLKEKDIKGTSFLDLVTPENREMINILLTSSGLNARINDVEAQFKMNGGKTASVSISGYRVPDFNNNFFLAVKVTPRLSGPLRHRLVDRDNEANVLNTKDFATIAANRIQSLQDAGGTAKLSMIKLDNFDEIKKNLSQEKQAEMFAAIGDVLNKSSLGGDTAGQVDETNFSVLHTDNVNADLISKQISDATKSISPSGIDISTQTATLDTEMAGLSEEQIQKAIIHTMKKFSDGDGALGQSSISGMFKEKMADTVKSVEAFRRVCKTRHFDLVYMPICDLKSGNVHHFEALTRFRGAAGGLESSPYELITLAEEVGIIHEFDLVVAEKAIEMIKENAPSRKVTPIAVNVSGHSIGNIEFVDKLQSLLQSVPKLNKYISLEITESTEIMDLDRVNDTIQSFREKGFKVSLDDFGAGAASFDYLNSFDVDTVKFDGPVVKRAYKTKKGKEFLSSMATLCRQSGIETIAEMVEDESLAKFLVECGVDQGQGYYYGKPAFDMFSFQPILPIRV